MFMSKKYDDDVEEQAPKRPRGRPRKKWKRRNKMKVMLSLYDEDKVEKINPETLKYHRKFNEWMEYTEKTPKTIWQYNSDLRQFYLYVYNEFDNKCVTEITSEEIKQYFDWRIEEGNAWSRIMRLMSVLSSFYRFLQRRLFIDENPMGGYVRPGRARSTVPRKTQEKVLLIEDEVKLEKNIKKRKRRTHKKRAQTK